jgi:tRNA pseudouridine55 synthase
VLLVDKPVGPTSHDAVARARRALRPRRIGHTGTLDPFASGLLVLLVGQATRLLPYVNGEPKVYDATIRFGAETETDDLTGAVARTAPAPDPADLDAAIAQLTGDIDQVPPAYSAKQVDGERAYAAARRGAPIELAPVRVRVDSWVRRAWRDAEQELDVTIACGSGTYIRSLARDLGRLTGSAAHLSALRRTHAGRFAVADAVPLAELTPEHAPVMGALDALQPIAVRLAGDADIRRVVQGQTLSAGEDPLYADGTRAAVVDDDRNVVAVAERIGGHWQPRVVLAHG